MITAIPIQVGTTIFSSSPSGLEDYVSKVGDGYTSILLVIIGNSLALRAQDILFSKKRGRHDESELVTEGIYSSTRHPIYFGFRLLSMAAILYNPSVENLISTGVVFGISELTARVEEKKMKVLYPQEYNEYISRVPRWIPKLSGVRTFTYEIIKYFSTILRNPSKW